MIEYMRLYISDKIYDTPYSDSVPLIAACGIKWNIFIVEKIGNGYDVKCIDSSGETANEKHPVLIYKNDDHYDTIEQILSDDNDDNDDKVDDDDDDEEEEEEEEEENGKAKTFQCQVNVVILIDWNRLDYLMQRT